MIVRISGSGQFDLDDERVARLRELDTDLTAALHAGDEERFHRLLHEVVRLVRDNGKPVSHDTVVPSELILPPEDITLDEAQRFFTDDELMAPVPT